jgi:hypothetical protein
MMIRLKLLCRKPRMLSTESLKLLTASKTPFLRIS